MIVSTLFKCPVFKVSNTCVNVLTVIPSKINLKSRSNPFNIQWHNNISKAKKEIIARKDYTKRGTKTGRENSKILHLHV